MGSGFRYALAGVGVIAVLFAALSLLPLYLNDRNASTTPAPPPVPATAPPSGAPAATATPPAGPMSGAQAVQSRPAALAPPTPAAPRSPLPANIRSKDSTPLRTWLYAKTQIVLLLEPNGRPHPAPSLTFAPLTVLRGTRLWPLETDGDWVMVKSPSDTRGWVKRQDLEVTPRFVRTY